MARKKTWREKMDGLQEPRLVQVPPTWRKRFAEGRMVIATPRHVDALVRKVRKGKLTTPALIGERLAADAGVEYACPLCTGIFLRIVAEVAEEDISAGKRTVTPWWRVVQADGTLSPRRPGEGRLQAQRLRAEGHEVTTGRGKALRVREFEAKLQRV